MPQQAFLHRPDEGSRLQPKRPQRALPSVRLQRGLPGSVQNILRLQRTIGNQATINWLQRQKGEGSATVVGSAAKEEKAEDIGSFTEELVKEKGKGETPSGEELTGELKKKTGEAHLRTQHPSIAQMGIRPKEITGKRLAAYIGNSKYLSDESIPELPGVKADAARMKSTTGVKLS